MMPYCFFRDGSGALLAVFVSIVRFLVVHSLGLLSFGGDAFVCLLAGFTRNGAYVVSFVVERVSWWRNKNIITLCTNTPKQTYNVLQSQHDT